MNNFKLIPRLKDILRSTKIIFRNIITSSTGIKELYISKTILAKKDFYLMIITKIMTVFYKKKFCKKL